MSPAQYNKINELLEQYSRLSAALKAAEAEIETVQLAAARELLPKHAQAKVALADVEATLRTLSDSHYAELFPADKRTHKTPFGSLEYRKSSSLEVEDEEKAILRIELEAFHASKRAAAGGPPARFEALDLIRTRRELNREALEQLDDTTLALFGITRKHKDNFKIVPFELTGDKPAKKNGKAKGEKEAA